MSFSASTLTKRFITASKFTTYTTPRYFSSTARIMSGTLNIENTNFKTASGVNLNDSQKTLVGSVLDLFAGRPSLEKLKLWTDEATFEDNITIANGRKQYEAQWYGLQSAFSEIERLSEEVIDAGNPIVMNMKTRYVIKGIKKEQTIDSVIKIFTTADGQKIEKVEDKWNGKLPESSFIDIFRNLNSVVVPKMISVPKNAEEDAKRGN